MGTEKEEKMHALIKLRFTNPEIFFGPGIAGLLKEIDRCGNVREACEQCGFSYSKGWTIIKKCEERFGHCLVSRQPGGSSGGSASVTDKGKALLAVYDALGAELDAFAEERFVELIKEYGLASDKDKKSE